MSKLVVFDCDSTLSALEGIDELARLRGEAIFRQSESMTREAMEGKIPLESVFARRLELIRPTLGELLELGQRYIDTVEPTARVTIAALKKAGWTPAVLSAGLLPAVLPLAEWLEIDLVRAVPLELNPDGTYKGFDDAFPPTRSGGKPVVVHQLKKETGAKKTVMVGDGVSDLEALPEVDLFVGFGGFVERPRVKAGSPRWITRLEELPPLLP